jgi:uncharacterized protein YcfJ
MHTNPTPSNANGILIIVRGIIENVAQYAEVADVTLLESIATAANQIAQDLRVEHDRAMAQIDEHEALMADALIAQSDAADHQIAHLM